MCCSLGWPRLHSRERVGEGEKKGEKEKGESGTLEKERGG